jgi:hypothetical protein
MKDTMNSKFAVSTGRLFAQPSFGSGFGRGLDLFGTFDVYNTSSEDDVDALALECDWVAVGEDMNTAIKICK